MKDTEYKLLDPISDMINGKFDELYKQGAFDDILQKLKEAVNQLPEGYSVSFDVHMNVFDIDKERGLSLLHTGINCSHGVEPHRHYADTAPQKYLVDGEMCIVPDEFCPYCWGEWNFKFQHGTCPECGYELGKQVKYLLDTDVCPYCQEGTVTVNKPVCKKCGFKVDGTTAVWG